MINKENSNKEEIPDLKKDTGLIDAAHMDVQCHLIIKDKETGEIIVNKRG